jgi:hypothetical protein
VTKNTQPAGVFRIPGRKKKVRNDIAGKKKSSKDISVQNIQSVGIF